MAKKKDGRKQVAKITIACFDNNECDFDMEGDKSSMIAALASLLFDNSEENEFHHMMNIAIAIVLEKGKRDRKKDVPKKRAAKKAV